MNHRSCRWFVVLSIFGLTACCGCGVSDRPAIAMVSGIVLLDGKPLSQGTVVFTPEFGRAATGTIQADGRFVLTSYHPGDGASLGKHRVAVIAREQLPSDGGPIGIRAGRSLIPDFYSDNAKSGLTFEVGEGRNNCEIKLSSTPTGP